MDELYLLGNLMVELCFCHFELYILFYFISHDTNCIRPYFKMISDYTFTTFVYLWIGLVLIPNNLKSLTAKALTSC